MNTTAKKFYEELDGNAYNNTSTNQLSLHAMTYAKS